MPTTLHQNRPSAGIGVVEVQKPMVFSDFQHARATLCGDRRGRGAKTHVVFCDFCGARATDRRGRGAKAYGFLRFLRCRAGIGVIEVQKPMDFLNFCCSNWSSGVVSWFARLLPEPAGRGFDSSLVRGRASQDATCILKQLAQSKLHRATCADQLAPTSLRRAPCLEQLAQSNLRRATCTEQLAQSSLHRATCRERNLHRATCREPLAGTNLPEQLARSNLRRATCTVQLV